VTLWRKMPYPVTPAGSVKETYPCWRAPAFGASMMAVAPALRLTVVEEPPTEGTFKGVPASAVKLTAKEAGAAPLLVKYNAEYQPPPNANCGRIFCPTLTVPAPDSENDELLVPVEVPEPVTERNEPLTPANFPVPAVIRTKPVVVTVCPTKGTRMPDGMEKLPTITSPLEKTKVKVPGIGPVV